MPRKKIIRFIRKETARYRLVLDTLGNQLAIAKTIGDEMLPGRQALIDQLQRRREGNLDRLFRLLGLHYAPADIIPIYHGLRTATPPERTSALEFLDTLLDNSLKQDIMPLVEYEVRSRVEETAPVGLSLGELTVMQNVYFTALLKGTDQKLKAAILYLLIHRPEEDLAEYVQMATKAPSQKVRRLATKALEVLHATVGTVP